MAICLKGVRVSLCWSGSIPIAVAILQYLSHSVGVQAFFPFDLHSVANSIFSFAYATYPMIISSSLPFNP